MTLSFNLVVLVATNISPIKPKQSWVKHVTFRLHLRIPSLVGLINTTLGPRTIFLWIFRLNSDGHAQK